MIRKAQYVVVTMLYFTVNAMLKAAQLLLFAWRLPKNPKTILILRAGHLGDTLCAVPALKGIENRFPDAHRILLTNQSDAKLPLPKEILERIVDFSEVMTYDPKRLGDRSYRKELIAQIKKKDVDLLIYLGQSIATPWRVFRDMIFFRLAGCKSAIGFQVDTLRYFVLAQRLHRRFLQEPERLLKLLKPLGIQGDWTLPAVSFEVSSITGYTKGPKIALHPWAKYPVKRWPLERFIEAADRLQKKNQALIVLIGGEDTVEAAETIRRKLSGEVVDLTAKTGFLETAAVLKECDLLLSNDSGPVHIAAAVNRPVVGIYSARDFPNAWYPSGKGHEILRKDVDCQICYLETCPVMTCINQISTDDVIAACDKILARSAANQRL